MSEHPTSISRRNFLKTGSFFSIAQIVVHDPALSMLSQAIGLGNADPANAGFTCELLRSEDLLRLKYYFFNAQICFGHAHRKVKAEPMYIYIQVPPQHVGEELVTENYSAYTSKAQFNRKKSFLSSSSWLAFELITHSVRLAPEALLDWHSHFRMLTLDSFAKSDPGNKRATDYCDAITLLIQAIDASYDPEKPLFYAWDDPNAPKPLTALAAPYKIWMSPIAEPTATPANDDPLSRVLGEHLFTGNNDLVRYYSYPQEKSRHIEIVSPWQNSMVFKNYVNNQVTSPRFKVLRAGCQDEYDNQSDLLPAPIHRDDLRGLTMRPEYDRDVLSEMFTLSALGATTNLKYHNDDPTILYSIIGWEHKMKLGRDNHVTVTFRAIDYFTGLKVKVSIIADREFSYGVSFLPKLFYVSYNEDHKPYTDPLEISRMPFTSITPKIKGTFFTPVPVPGNGGYIVCSKDAFGTGAFDPSALMDFPYDAVDKNGKPISTDAKMILILAEDYRITQGVFYPNGQPPPYNQGATVKIQDIGFLNPGRRDIYAGHPHAGCSLDDGQNYQFQMVKTFNASNYNGLNNKLTAIQQHVTANAEAYLSSINDSMTFSKLDRLKVNPAPTTPAPIKKDSQNTTFKTSTLLLGSEINPALFPSDGSGSPNTDNFFQEFPILPGMASANVIISQIDQLQGRSEYHAVKYFEPYRISQLEIDDNGQNLNNKSRIFFELTQGISNFFSDNYRNAGAMVNPGIRITHVSAYDNSISYNDSLIMQPQPAHLAAVDPTTTTVAMSPVSASSIFRELNAQILGVSLLQILEDFLGLDNIPAFAWLNQIEQTADSIQQLAAQYQQYAGTWKEDFDTLTSDVSNLQSQIDQIQNQLKTLSKDGLRTWLEGMEQQIASQYLYTIQLDAGSIAPLATYVTTNLLPLYNYAQGINSSAGHPGPLNNLGTSLDGILAAAAADPVSPLNNLIDTVMTVPVPDATKFNETHFKEAAKAYFANVLMTQPNKWTIYQQLMTELAAASGQIDSTRIRYYNAFNEGIQEAAIFSAGLIRSNLTKVQAMVTAQAAQIPVYITDGMSQAGISLSTGQINGWFTILWELINLYDNYYKQYVSLKKEYYAQLYIVFPAKARPDQTPIGQIQTELIGRMNIQLDALKLPPNMPKPIEDGFTALKGKLSNMIAGSANTLLQEYTTQIQGNEYIVAIQGARGVLTKLLQNLLDQYDQVVQQLQDAQKKILAPKQQLDNFIQNELDKLRQQVNDKLQQLAAAAQGSAAYSNLVQEINQINTFLTAIRSLAHQNLHYTFSTTNFKQASLGGIIEFIPQDGVTELDLTIDYQVDLNLGSFNQQPGISQQSFTADTSLTRFKLGLLSLLYIDFDQVRFVASSDKKDDFTVRVSNVEFAGFVSFFQIFQQFLQSLTDDFAFDITADGVSITYGLTLPDITTGYFNLFNLGLDCMIILPFHPDKALELHFGIGSPDKKFGLTVMGIFGGQGYFNIIADPKRGIIGMDITFEFGAIFILDIAVASGSACLVAGIYIRKYDGQWDLRGYILCAGRLDVLGIFSASLSFYLGLEGDGQVIAGRCTLTASCKIGFFEISVECGMYKEIQGTKSNPPNNAPAARQAVVANQAAVAASAVETNVKQLQFYPGDELYFTVPSNPKQPAAATAVLTKDGVDHPFEAQTAKSGAGNLTHLTYDLSNTAPGTYAVKLAGPTPQTFQVTVADEDNDAVEANLDNKGNSVKVSKKSYYSSYFKKS